MLQTTSPILLFYFLSLCLSSGSGTPFPGQQRQHFNFNPFPVYDLSSLRPSAETSKQSPSSSSFLSSPSSSSPSFSSSLQGSSQPEAEAAYPLYSPVFLDQIMPPPSFLPIPQSVIRSQSERLPRLTSFPEIRRRSTVTKTTSNFAAKRLARVNRQGNMIDADYNIGDNNKSRRNGSTSYHLSADNRIDSWHGEEREMNPLFTSSWRTRSPSLTSNKDQRERKSAREHGMDRRSREEQDHQSSSVVVADTKKDRSPQLRSSGHQQQQQRISMSPAADSRSSPHSSSSSASPPSPILTTSDPSLISSLKSAPYQFMNLIPARKTRESRLFDVPQVECPPSEDEADNFACPSPDSQGRYRCIGSHALCDGFRDCPKGEDEDRKSCLFYKSTKAHLDVLADALLRWARQRY